jgi:hypothetical protein
VAVAASYRIPIPIRLPYAFTFLQLQFEQKKVGTMNADWFVGSMDRDDAVKFLMSQPKRAFIVRLNQNGLHCVTARLAGDGFVHTLLEQRPDDGKFVVQRAGGDPIVGRSVQDALEQLGYLAPAVEDLYVPAPPASSLHNHYVALPLAPAPAPSKISPAPTNVSGYVPVPAEPLIASTAKSKGSGVTAKTEGSGVKVAKSAGSAVAVFRAPTAPAQPPTQHYLPTDRVIAVVQGAAGADAAGADLKTEKKSKKHRHRHRHRSNKGDPDE